jgi:hypothetical protein
MGKVELVAKKRRRQQYIQDAVMAAVSGAGLLAVAMLAPNILQILPHITGKKRSKLAFKTKTAASRLAAKGYIRFINRGGKKYIEITKEGSRAIAFEREKAQLVDTRKRKWDKRYRLVMFDIPQTRKTTRDRVRLLMRECGFLRLQDSVWIFPHDCEELIVLAKADLRVGKDIVYAVVESMENDGWIKKHFGLA